MNVRFGPTISTPSRASDGFAYSSHAARCRPTAVLPVPGPPWITSAGVGSSRIIPYCSGVIVAMIWRISPTRWRVMSSTIASVRWPGAPAAGAAARILGGRGVERLGRRGAPVDDEHLVVAVDDDVAADVERPAVALGVVAAEVERPARLGVDADALAAHALERLVGELV